MDIRALLVAIDDFLVETFAAVDAWFDQPTALLDYEPADHGWTAAQVLNHIGLTTHYLLILIEKSTAKALLNRQGLQLSQALATYEFPYQQLAVVGVLGSFAWVRPDHMEPRTHWRPLPEVRQQLQAQLTQLQNCLTQLSNGEGLLHRTTMSVNNFGKLNVYEYIYFAGQHAQRHLTQLRENAAEYQDSLA